MDTISREAAKLNAIARHLEELAAMYPDCRFFAAYDPRPWSGCWDAGGREDAPRGGSHLLAGLREAQAKGAEEAAMSGYGLLQGSAQSPLGFQAAAK
ncbi:MAG: hypothetical protein DMG09_23345 [Acidobacteria bacterium]|nr:MAG: hypothetical protein DMG09_23345 [Acidobacteriota bacterium]